MKASSLSYTRHGSIGESRGSIKSLFLTRKGSLEYSNCFRMPMEGGYSHSLKISKELLSVLPEI